jgi:hypothetical protein
MGAVGGYTIPEPNLYRMYDIFPQFFLEGGLECCYGTGKYEWKDFLERNKSDISHVQTRQECNIQISRYVSRSYKYTW